ncbi:MAG: hypothetical protein Fur0021_13320 [Candidatus Promineifilaceae bacterium]
MSTYLEGFMWIQIRECENRDCFFRYPVLEKERPGVLCPRCGRMTRLVSERYVRQEANQAVTSQPVPQVVALLDNIRSVFNVGSMFRIADGSGISHLHLGGITPTPEHSKMGKTALGAERTVPWSYHVNGLQAAQKLQAANYRLWAIEENGPQVNSLFTAAPAADRPIVLIVGNEVAGIDPDILTLCECVFSIPMQGQKRSLNVAVAFGIAAYTMRYALFWDQKGYNLPAWPN